MAGHHTEGIVHRRPIVHPRAWLVPALLASVLTAARVSATDPPPRVVDLGTALALARENNPRLEAVRSALAEARGDLTAASVLLVENPEFEIGIGPRLPDQAGVASSLGLEAGLSQRIEVAGQRGHRRDRAVSEIGAAAADVEAAARALDLAVATGFYQALAAAERVRIAEEHERLATELLDIAKARFQGGAATPVDVNTALVRKAEAVRQTQRARAEHLRAAIRIAETVGLSPGTPVTVRGELPAAPSMAPEALAAIALDGRPEVVAASGRVRAAEAAAALASAQAWPDVRLGARYGVEEDSRVLLGTVAIPLPLFQRNQGERERARAAIGRLAAEERATRASLLADALEARLELNRAMDAVALYDESVLRALGENLEILRRMLGAGKIGQAEVIVLQRELLEGRLGYVDARLELAVADARARTAVGLPLVARTDHDGGAR